MKIEKINKDNIKEYIRDMGIDITYVDEKQLINNTFGVKKDNKFLFGFVSFLFSLIYFYMNIFFL